MPCSSTAASTPSGSRTRPGGSAAKRRSTRTASRPIYRLRLTKSEELAAVYFNPNETKLPPVVFAPFFDKGEMVTPCYWGSHWPLARGNATGNAIDDRIGLTPCHNSVMSWAGTRPRPLRTGELVTLDTLGRSRPMTVRTWAWLIGMSGETDARLVERAKSFATPLALELRGARVGFDGYAPERRAIRLVARARRSRSRSSRGSLREPGLRIRERPARPDQGHAWPAGHSIQAVTPGTAARSGSMPR